MVWINLASMVLAALISPVMAGESTTVSPTEELKVGAFNIQVLGVTKMGKPEVVQSLVQIISRYDVLLIQEIRDATGESIPALLDAVNSATGEGTYAQEISPRLGRSTSKEQYSYFYRPSKVQMVATRLYNDTSDVFEREPYAIKLHPLTDGIPDFFLIGIHTKPDTSETDAELNHLDNVYDDMSSYWSLQDGVILGDFNADCTYVVTNNWPDIELWTDQRFTWLIPHDADTTVSSTDCAYDRIVVAGPILPGKIQSGSAQVYRFDLDLGLTNEQALDVSDHYPVEFDIVPEVIGPRLS